MKTKTKKTSLVVSKFFAFFRNSRSTKMNTILIDDRLPYSLIRVLRCSRIPQMMWSLQKMDKIVMKTMTHTTALLQDKRKKVMHLEVKNMLIFLQIPSWSTLWISKMNCSFGTLLQEVMQNSDADAWENLPTQI